MGTLTLYTRSFHPRASFGTTGFGFHGDNRGFETKLNVTSRIESVIYINLSSPGVVAPRPRSDPSTHPAGMSTDYGDSAEQPTGRFTGGPVVSPYRPDGAQHVTLTYAYRGKNHAAMPKAMIGGIIQNPLGDWLNRKSEEIGVPDLDVTVSLSISIDRERKKAVITATIRGDGFPNAEVFLLDPTGAPLFLLSHVRVGTASGQLWGNALIRMGSTSLIVDLTDEDGWAGPMEIVTSMDHAGDGSPVQVGTIGSTTVSAWNGVHTGRDAVGPESRRALDDNWGNMFRSEDPLPEHSGP